MTEPKVWYFVRDLDRAREFYKDRLGFEETAVDWNERCATLERGVMRIALAEGEPAEGGVAMVDVDDIKQAAAELRAHGVQVGTVVDLIGQVRLVDVFDPDGNRIQLAEHVEE